MNGGKLTFITRERGERERERERERDRQTDRDRDRTLLGYINSYIVITKLRRLVIGRLQERTFAHRSGFS